MLFGSVNKRLILLQNVVLQFLHIIAALVGLLSLRLHIGKLGQELRLRFFLGRGGAVFLGKRQFRLGNLIRVFRRLVAALFDGAEHFIESALVFKLLLLALNFLTNLVTLFLLALLLFLALLFQALIFLLCKRFFFLSALDMLAGCVLCLFDGVCHFVN